jgi:hypothetical protein
MSAPVLTLTTKDTSPKRTVKIDGKAYALRPATALGLKAGLFQRTAKRLIEIETGPLTDEVEQEYAAGAESACRIILDAPDAVHKKLDVGHRIAIITDYVMAMSPQAGKK